MNSGILRGAAAAAWLAVPSFGFAATVTVNQTVDVSGCFSTACSFGAFAGAAGTFATSTPFNVNVGVGDTINLNFDFFGGQQLTATNLNAVFAALIAEDFGQAADITMTGALSLLSANGTTLYTTAPLSDISGSIHIGQVFATNNSTLTGIPSTITFGGISYSGTATAYSNGFSTRAYDQGYLILAAEQLVFSTLSPAVPEPSTWAMMILGFAGVGFTGYWQSQRTRKSEISF